MKTVLIIDDNAQFRQLLGEILAANGWSVLEAADGESGLRLVSQYRPQVVLCDLLMPRGNGFQVCRDIRSSSLIRPVRIIVTTGRDYPVDRQAAKDAGADAYLTKPISTEAILKTIAELTAAGAPPVFPAGSGSSAPAHIKFWGVRGSIPTPGSGTVVHGGNTSCIEFRAGKEIIILDAGTGLRGLGRALLAEFKDQPLNLTLLLTHTHWDHIQGLPFFGPLYSPNCRLRILGYEGARKSLEHILSGQMESPYFPVPFQKLPGNIEIEEVKDLQFQVGSVRAAAWFANHPGICVGYRLFADAGSFAYIPDNEPIMRHRIETAFCPVVAQDSVNFAKDEEARMIDFLRGTDVLALDSQYDREEYQQHVGWGHGCVDDAVSIAARAEVQRLYLFHHDPDHDDTKVAAMAAHGRKLAQEAGSNLQVNAAREGELVPLRARAGKS